MTQIKFSIYKPGVSAGRYTALRTTKLSATAPRSVGALISSGIGGAGSVRRVVNWYASQGVTAKQYYNDCYPKGIIVL